MVELLCGLLVGRVLKIRPEQTQVFLLLGSIKPLKLIEFCILLLDLLLDDACESDPDVMVGALGHLDAQVLESLR